MKERDNCLKMVLLCAMETQSMHQSETVNLIQFYKVEKGGGMHKITWIEKVANDMFTREVTECMILNWTK